MAVSELKPRLFVSYSRKNEDQIRQMRTALFSAGVDCWIDVADIEPGERINPVISGAISQSDVFFAYVTRDFLASRWCMDELRYALGDPQVEVAPYVDSLATLDLVPGELLSEVAFGYLTPDKYVRCMMEVAGRAWASLQRSAQLVPSGDHILAGPAIFDSDGYSRLDLMARTRGELILAGPNLRSWLSDAESKDGLVDLVAGRGVRVMMIMATYETLRPIAAEGAIHLRRSVADVQEMRAALPAGKRNLMPVFFHVGASTLSAVFIDPRLRDGLLFFSPRWAIQFLPQDRLTCIIDKSVNDPALYKALYNGILLMTQGDAKTIDEMLESGAS
jgi:hypothetical protein